MKKYILVLLTITVSAIMCGCGATIPDMTDAQKTVVTEYATNLLVKYSTISDRSLLNDKELEEGIAKEAEERERLLKIKELEEKYQNGASETNKEATIDEPSGAESSGNESAGEVVTTPQLAVADFFAEHSFSIDYSSYTLCQSYPEGGGEDFFMAMDATPGKKLCIVKFNVSNITSSEQSLDMYAKRGRFSLKLDDGSVVKAQSTLLMDDLSSYTGTIPAGKTEQMVLVFEVSDTLSQIGSMQLIMNNESGENTLILQ